MKRVRRYGPLSNRAYRTVAAGRSVTAALRLWRLLKWHDKMWLLYAFETVPREERGEFADKIAGAIRTAWVKQMSKP